MEDKIQVIADTNAGRALEAFEIAGVENQALRSKIKKLIFFTADDVRKELEKNK